MIELINVTKKYDNGTLALENVNIQIDIPIYFNSNLVLFPLRDDFQKKYWINYAMLRCFCYENGLCSFYFFNNECLKIQISRRKINSILKKVQKLIDYINNI